jgi:hypothetical protein
MPADAGLWMNSASLESQGHKPESQGHDSEWRGHQRESQGQKHRIKH